MRLFLPVFLVCLAYGAQRPSAQKPAPRPQAAWPIQSITIEGNKEYSREQILTVAGLRVGQSVTPKEIEAARDRLTASGAFETLEFGFGPAPEGKGYAIVFQLTEAGPFYPIVFEDLGIPDSAAREALKHSDPLFGDRIPATKATLDRYTKVLEAALPKPEKLSSRVGYDDAGKLAVVFRPARGLPVVARVRFTGQRVLPSSLLENTMNAVAVGLAYRETRFRALLDTNIRPLYEARGRLAVAFPTITTEKEKDVDGLLVTVIVSEGETYSLRSVSVEGVEDSKPLVKEARLKTGDLFNLDELRAGAARIEKALRRDGYTHAKTRIDRTTDAQARQADVVIHVERGPQYRFGKLNIEGLDLTTEPVIRKLWAMKAGQPFNADYPDFFLQRIREDNLFENLGDTKVKIDTDDVQHVADVTLVFKAEKRVEKKEY